jgi:hypothetical protein
MRLLWLGASEIESAELPPEALTQNVAARLLGDAAGAEVEVLTRRVWPSPNMPDAVERWLERLKPDLVYLWVSSYPACCATVPIRMRQLFGRWGETVGEAGVAAAGDGWLLHSPAFGAARWLARHTIGARTNFEPMEVVAVMDATIRSILQQEGIGLVVAQSPRPVYVVSDRELADARWRTQSTAVSALCNKLHVPCIDLDTGVSDDEIRALRGRDSVHFNEAGHLAYGTRAAEALAALLPARAR